MTSGWPQNCLHWFIDSNPINETRVITCQRFKRKSFQEYYREKMARRFPFEFISHSELVYILDFNERRNCERILLHLKAISIEFVFFQCISFQFVFKQKASTQWSRSKLIGFLLCFWERGSWCHLATVPGRWTLTKDLK